MQNDTIDKLIPRASIGNIIKYRLSSIRLESDKAEFLVSFVETIALSLQSILSQNYILRTEALPTWITSDSFSLELLKNPKKHPDQCLHSKLIALDNTRLLGCSYRCNHDIKVRN